MTDVPSSELPQGRVLSYIAAADSPTRVRRVAAVAVFIVGVLNVLYACGGLVYIGAEIKQTCEWMPGGVMSLANVLKAIRYEFAVSSYSVVPYAPDLALLAVIPALASPVLLITARAIFLGRRIPSLLARHYLLVPMMQILFFTAIYVGYGIIMSIPIRGVSEPEYLVRLLVLPVPTLAVLLLMDLSSYLLWISRNPVTEKPAVAFLPGKNPAVKGAL